VNEILDWSKIEAGEIALERAPFSLASCLDTIRALFSAKARAAKVELRTEVRGPSEAPWVLGDALRFTQVITNNFVSNALKYTPHGGRVDVIRQCQNGSDGMFVRASVTDTGIGISEEAQRSLFKPFHQAEASTTRKYGGTGLGLSISKRLVELMRGRIGVTSAPNKDQRSGSKSCLRLVRCRTSARTHRRGMFATPSASAPFS
jgi:signal transduction histidine kinase